MRTETKLQAVDSWCAWRTLQTWLYLNAMIFRHIRASLAMKYDKFTFGNLYLLFAFAALILLGHAAADAATELA